MDDPQLQDMLERIEVAVIVDQFVVVQQTKSRDQAINRFAHCSASSAQQTVVVRGCRGERTSSPRSQGRILRVCRALTLMVVRPGLPGLTGERLGRSRMPNSA